LSTVEELHEAFEAYIRYGSYTKAAKKLGIDSRTVKRRAVKYENSPEYSTFRQNCLDTGTDPNKVAYYWLKTDDVSLLIKNNSIPTYDEIRDEMIAEFKNHAPVYTPIVRSNDDGEHLLVVDPADIHIGKYSKIHETGADYNIETAVERVRKGVTSLLTKAVGFGVKKIVFVIGNDVLHIDSPHRKTTAGTPQDTDGQWWEMFLEAKKCYIAAIEEMTQVADVHVVFCPSNHDYTSGWMLADTISSWFRNNRNVSFGLNNRNVSISHRKYVEYGNNIIGFTHGDGAKEKDLPTLMQFEAREAWGRAKHAYWYVHHTHHKNRATLGLNAQKLEKDHIGITVLETGKSIDPVNNIYIETVRSPSPADGWHDRNGYKNSQAIEAFLHHPTDGQVARFTHFF
jgi:hypothetical protein